LMKSIEDSMERAADQINAQNQLLEAAIKEDAYNRGRSEA